MSSVGCASRSDTILEQTHLPEAGLMILLQVWETISCQIAIDLRIFDVIEKKKEACTTAVLAKEVNVDPLFLGG